MRDKPREMWRKWDIAGPTRRVLKSGKLPITAIIKAKCRVQLGFARIKWVRADETYPDVYWVKQHGRKAVQVTLFRPSGRIVVGNVSN